MAATVAGCSGNYGKSSPKGTSSSALDGTITVKGSDTMVILAQRWAEAFMKLRPGVAIQVSGGGSGTGIAALLNGTTDIATASRPIEAREKAQLKATRGVEVAEFKVAVDAIAVYVHESNRVPKLDMAQLGQLFRGHVPRWNAVGGNAEPVVLYGRENSSGTYAYFKEHVLKDEDFAAEAQTLPGTAAVIHAVSHDPHAVGYGGIAYAHGVRRVPIADQDGVPIEPNEESTATGRYPLARFLFMYTAGTPTGIVQAFLKWVTGPDGQQTVKNVGFYPLPASALTVAPVPSAGAEVGHP